MFDDLDWHDLVWSENSVRVKDTATISPLLNFKLYDIAFNNQ